MSAIAKKLLIKPGKNWLFYHAPENYLSILEPMPEGVTAHYKPEGNFDGVQLFVLNSSELTAHLKEIAHLLKRDTVLWITYPKKSSGIKTDLEMMGNWEEPAKYGLRVVSAASIDNTWTALRLTPEEQTKISEFRNGEIKISEHSAFIDTDNRKIILPADMYQTMAASAGAMTFFESLSFSNKKEYVVWILSAKQEKTRMERLEKLVDKLLSGKKNPSEK